MPSRNPTPMIARKLIIENLVAPPSRRPSRGRAGRPPDSRQDAGATTRHARVPGSDYTSIVTAREGPFRQRHLWFTMGAVAENCAQNSIIRVLHGYGFRVGEDARQKQSVGFSDARTSSRVHGGSRRNLCIAGHGGSGLPPVVCRL